MADRGLDDVAGPEVAADRLGLGRRLDDHQLGARLRRPCSPRRAPARPVVSGARRSAAPVADGTGRSRCERCDRRQRAVTAQLGQSSAAAVAGRRPSSSAKPAQPLGRGDPPARAAAQRRSTTAASPSRDSWAPAAQVHRVVGVGGGRAGSRPRRGVRPRSPTAAARRRQREAGRRALVRAAASSARPRRRASGVKAVRTPQPPRPARSASRPVDAARGERLGQRVGAPPVGDHDRQPGRPGRAHPVTAGEQHAVEVGERRLGGRRAEQRELTSRPPRGAVEALVARARIGPAVTVPASPLCAGQTTVVAGVAASVDRRVAHRHLRAASTR